ncbi:tRNA adenosine(34) deaminase TadA [Psittacicella melopsittaci]|nr:tRNA adenosine(34) deaminase TadA [Psittacicella melopsittaci]
MPETKQEDKDLFFMELCLDLVKIAQRIGEVPIASIVVLDDKIVGIGINMPINLKDPTAHAEVLAIRDAGHRIGNYRLINSTIYATLEPCTMCAGSIIHARCKRVVFGAGDPKTGAIGGRFNLFRDFPMNHIPQVTKGVREEKVREELLKYFKKRREVQKSQKRLLRAATQLYSEK